MRPSIIVTAICIVFAFSCANSQEASDYFVDSTDPDPSSESDSGFDSQTQSDNPQSSDSESETTMAETGIACDNPVEMEPDNNTLSFADVWSHYPNDTFDSSMPGCLAAGGNIIWFAVDVPAQWVVSVRRTAGSLVSINIVDACDAEQCLASGTSTLTWANETDDTSPIYIAVQDPTNTPQASVNIQISLRDATGETCQDAMTWDGQETTYSLGDFENSTMPTDCSGYTSPTGANLWLAINVPAAHQLDFQTTDPLDTLVGYSLDCASCAHYSDTPESFTYTNTGSVDVELKAYIQGYSASSSDVTAVATLTALPEGDACGSAIDVNENDLDNYTWQDSNPLISRTCSDTVCPGTTGSDIWHSITVGAGQILLVDKVAGPDAFIGVVSQCSDTESLAFVPNAEKLVWENTGAEQTVYVVAGGMSASDISTMQITFDLFAPADGDFCSTAYEVPTQATWNHTGLWADVDDYYTAGQDCGEAAGVDVWFKVQVDAAKILHVEDNGTNDLVFQILEACDADTCKESGSSAKKATYLNVDTTPKQLYVIVESASATLATTGWDVNFIQETPPAGDLCAAPISITTTTDTPNVWAEQTWDYFINSEILDPNLGCGSAAGRDAWFLVTVPGESKLEIDESTTLVPTIINIIEGCGDTDRCIYSEPNHAVWFNTSAAEATVLVSVKEVNVSAAANQLNLTFLSTDIIEGDACSNPIPAVLPITDDVDIPLAGFDSSWPMGICEDGNGPDVWYQVTVPAGEVLSFEETSTVDSVVYLTEDCPATECLISSNEPEEAFWYNDSGTNVTLYAVARAKSIGDREETLNINMSTGTAEEGDFCTYPFDLSAQDLTAAVGYTLPGNLATFSNGFTGQTANSCAETLGDDVWYKVSVPAGYWLYVTNSQSEPMGIQIKTDCSTQSCVASGTQITFWQNESAATEQVLVAIDKVAAGSGTYNITFKAEDIPPTKFGPDAYGYWGATDEDMSQCRDITGTGTALPGMTDSIITEVTMGLSFEFYGTSYSSVWVTTDGFITFTEGKYAYPSEVLPTGSFDPSYGSAIIPAIALMWQDMDGTTSDADQDIFYEKYSADGHDYFQVQYNVVPYGVMGSGTYDFSVVLDATTKKIHLCYHDTEIGNAANDKGLRATVGIQGSLANYLQFSHNEAVIESGMHIWIVSP